jgi:hypothetical protein
MTFRSQAMQPPPPALGPPPEGRDWRGLACVAALELDGVALEEI